ncbi:MAG: phosphohydrolase [Acidimicrobiaceae bacterium]|nr:phosphohydrolase [Acidimicrobiaceae bacterium]MYG99564.1 phosphohydrolase [Acidimicrobiaceae bacterium]MYL04796.1 phosphohydrolase [Acidimicrobiaceae bacterium]
MPISEPPRFLETAARTTKPRRRGITHIIDKGTPLESMGELLEAHGAFVDVWKFGFGTAYIDSTVGAKIELLETHGVKACPGGTLLEAAWWQGRSAEFFDWSRRLGFGCVEVSRGATGLPASSKRELIGAARGHGFEVFSEVGSKDPHEPALPSEWLDEARSDLDCGAAWLVAEGRESGTVGLYGADGSVRTDLVEALGRLGEDAPVVYEAPRRQQQAWLINHLGANVNLANIAPAEVLGVEALRRGLRSDTLRTSLPTHTAGSLGGP